MNITRHIATTILQLLPDSADNVLRLALDERGEDVQLGLDLVDLGGGHRTLRQDGLQALSKKKRSRMVVPSVPSDK